MDYNNGFSQRFEYINKLLAIVDKSFPDTIMNSLDVKFNVNRPVDTNSLMNELKVQKEMGAMSVETIIDLSPYCIDTPLELERIKGEEGSAAGTMQ